MSHPAARAARCWAMVAALGALSWATPAAALELSPGAVAARTPRTHQWQVARVAMDSYFPAAERDAWRAYHRQLRRADLVALGLDLVIYLMLLCSWGRWLEHRTQRWARRLAANDSTRRPLLRRLGGLLERAFGADWAPALLFAAAYFAIGVLVELPTSLWQEVVNQQAGISVYTPGAWIIDLVKGMLLGALFFALLVFGLYGLIRRFPRAWWALLALPASLALLGHSLVAPYQTRLFHEMVPLHQHTADRAPELTRRLERLVASQGISLKQTNVVKASRVSTAFNAYLTGVGPSRQLVLYDTLFPAATAEEIETIVAHELGHLVHGSGWETHLLPVLGLIGLLALLAVVLRRGSRLFGLGGPGAIRTLPLLGLTVTLVLNLALPLRNVRSRQHELEADRFALALTGNPEAFISLQVKVARRNKEDLEPSPSVRLWFFSHPPVAERIGLAIWYRDWLRRRGRQAPTTRRYSTRPVSASR